MNDNYKTGSGFIRVRGARKHNLKNIDVDIPRDKLVVITGLSGSGKSSLAFDTIYAEGQRRYVESLSSYARQFLGQMEKPDVDQIDGLSPAISIDQKSASRNPRSTVATVTEIYDYLRLLFARVGIPHCPICGKVVEKRSAQHIVDEIMKLDGARVYIGAPIAKQKKGEFAHIPEQFMAKGFARARVDSVIYALDEWPTLDKNFKHDIELIVDRLVISPDSVSRITQSVESAIEIGGGSMEIIIINNDGAATTSRADSDVTTSASMTEPRNDGREGVVRESSAVKVVTFSTRYVCVDHLDEVIPELEPRLFSFNAPFGACPTCMGLGARLEVDPELVLNSNLTISEGAIRPFNRVNVDAWWMKKLAKVGEKFGFTLRTLAKDLTDEQRNAILYGTGNETYEVNIGNHAKWGENGRVYNTTYEGVIPNLERRWKETDSEFMRKDIERFMRERECTTCHGTRLKPVVQAVTVHDLSIVDVCNLSVDDALDIFSKIKWSEQEMFIGKQIFKEINDRLTFMKDVGLNYLELGRAANTLSGGEAQRIRLATQIGSGLQGVLYVLDEPSIGLHQRDNDRLIVTLKHLRDLGNTVLVVEHDEDTIREADYLLDIGPEAGVKGGYVIAAGTPAEVAKNPDSITGRFLSGTEKIPVPKKRRPLDPKRQLVVRGANEHNLKNIDAVFPLGVLNVVSGVSGSGKSTLVNDILSKELSARLNRSHDVAGSHKAIDGIENLDKIITIDQSPIGRTPRSNPATYTGIFTNIRDLFAATPEANIRGYKSGRFSFNVRGGRCENCQGDGGIKLEMHFLPDVYVTCSECGGARYNREALEIKWRERNISEVLNMTVDEAADFFAPIPAIARKLETLKEVGLGYITLGQPATTFSGGEAQRIKLATELSRRATGKTLYVLDEPTTGLHPADVRKLLSVLQQLVAAGNSMVVIEHNLDVIKCADNIIDLGPDGGLNGGYIVASGTPEDIAKNPKSATGRYLKTVL
ncbi:MAG: excinuclease ABC subunit UvrA [Candidatus Nomurabacteria bacterium]|jgi:excinuclease ABC subunit A|nr:excinuclease ABC subunit UvrA [Candidatus Nomurabacteria bacterium]